MSVDPAHLIASGEKTLPTLKGGDVVFNNNFAQVDEFSRLTGGVATLFVRDGDSFFRVTTSVKNNKEGVRERHRLDEASSLPTAARGAALRARPRCSARTT
ncbi:MAG: Cache 3/Cache 2 fusion domain-containing protein [Zoogloea sp.]|nr:Cache 3/Cache 2 fusion domain-containing protein [Zoogloea sp.]